MNRVVVIGAGLAGLATACHLARTGVHVTVIERESEVGGRNGVWRSEGFTFDTGPTVLTMPELVAGPIVAAGGDPDALLQLQRVEPAYRGVFADGSEMFVHTEREAMIAEIERVSGPRDAARYDPFVGWLERLYDAELDHFIDRNLDSPLDLLTRPWAAARLLAEGAFAPLGPRIRRWFDDERLHRLFSFQAMYAGLAPEKALALYAVITYMDSVRGVWFPRGGMHAVPRALARTAADAGVEFRLGSEVEAVLRRGDGSVAGVATSSGPLMADAVVCTLDLPTAYERLVPDLPLPRALRRPRWSPSCVVWHVGVRGESPSGAGHHNIHFGRAWDDAFDDLLERGRLMRDPSRLVTIPSRDDPSLAPAGCSTLYVLEPAPNLTGEVDWERERGPMRERLHDFLGEHGYPDDVVTERWADPVEWQREGMAAGTPFALAHTFTQTGPFRPSNVARRLPGLVFAGSGTTPGVGVPMVLISGRLAAERVGSYLGGRR